MGELAPATGQAEIVSALVTKGDLSGLTIPQRVAYYNAFCEHLGLDPLTQPFQLLSLSNRLVLYANKTCAEQLRKANGVSVDKIEAKEVRDIYIVTVIGHDKTGRNDGATGAVSIKGLAGDTLVNAMLKAETKAKRRFTLSICGLGIMDETEVETVPGARTVDLSVELSESTPVDSPEVPSVTEADGRKILLKRLGALGPYVTDDEKTQMRKEALGMPVDKLTGYVETWEKTILDRQIQLNTTAEKGFQQ